MKTQKGKHGGRRPGAGRPRKPRLPPTELIDADLVLRQIASDPLQPASARVAAAKAILAADKGGDGDKAGSIASDLERRTLAILNREKLN